MPARPRPSLGGRRWPIAATTPKEPHGDRSEPAHLGPEPAKAGQGTPPSCPNDGACTLGAQMFARAGGASSLSRLLKLVRLLGFIRRKVLGLPRVRLWESHLRLLYWGSSWLLRWLPECVEDTKSRDQNTDQVHCRIREKALHELVECAPSSEPEPSCRSLLRRLWRFA